MQHSIKLSYGIVIILILALVIAISRWIVITAPDITPSLSTATATSPLPTLTYSPSPTPAFYPSHTPTPTPSYTFTPTPSPSHTPIPTHTPTPSPMARPFTPPPPLSIPLTGTAIISSPLPVPSPMPLLEQDDDVINILLLGSDQSANESGLTDVILIVSVNPGRSSVSLLSIPRDFYAWIPGYGFDKINTTWRHGAGKEGPGGAALLKSTIEYNLGIRIHYYARVGFDGFIKIVDALGGVDVAVECPLSDTFPDPNSPTGQTDVDWLPGIQHLDGQHALWYVRSRWSTSDFDRNRRQQQVARGLYQRILTLDVIPRLPELWDALRENVSTDLPLAQLLYLANIGARMDTLNVKSGFVGRSVLQPWTAPNGMYVLVPYYDALIPLIHEAMTPPATGRAQQRRFRVEVWNATSVEGLGHVAAERLRWEGFEVVNVGPADGVYSRTQIVDFTSSAKGSAISHLSLLYRREARDIVSRPGERSEVDYRVILGNDYDPCAATKIHWSTTEPLPTPTPLPTLPPHTPTFTPTLTLSP